MFDSYPEHLPKLPAYTFYSLEKERYMKAGLLLTGVVALAGCFSSRDIQVDVVNAELVRIDTVYRYPEYKKVLVWKTPSNVEYLSFAAMKDVYTVGSKLPVLVRR